MKSARGVAWNRPYHLRGSSGFACFPLPIHFSLIEFQCFLASHPSLNITRCHYQIKEWLETGRKAFLDSRAFLLSVSLPIHLSLNFYFYNASLTYSKLCYFTQHDQHCFAITYKQDSICNSCFQMFILPEWFIRASRGKFECGWTENLNHIIGQIQKVLVRNTEVRNILYCENVDQS